MPHIPPEKQSEAILELAEAIKECKEHECENSGYNWLASFITNYTE